VSSRSVAVLGLGEAGGRIAADLVAAGADVRGYDPVATSTPEGVVRAPDPSEAVAGSDAVLSLTAAGASLDVAAGVLPVLPPDAVYADLSTASPTLKRQIAARAEDAGRMFADVALLGPVPARGLGTPALASGSGAQAFADVLSPLGMPVDVVSDRPGIAAGMKLLRSVFMKGLAASAIESLRAADAAGHREWLEGELAEVVGRPLLERLLEGSRAHAARRVDEMEAARELLLELGVEPRITGASMALLSELAQAGDR
jgi:3-hydroxyisobutyrate dehydrogenase-like beta-hydroxyacid dehydrogenase